MNNFYQGSQYEIDLQSVRLDTFRLLSYISAGVYLPNHERFFEKPVGGLWTQFSETEITSALILIAIRMRVWLEQVNDSIDTSKLLCGGTNVNCYHAEHKIEKLDLREACNKIIHAKKIRLQEASLQFIFIYGENRKIPWKTTLDLFQFVEHVCTLTLSRDQFSK